MLIKNVKLVWQNIKCIFFMLYCIQDAGRKGHHDGVGQLQIEEFNISNF